MGGRCVIGNMMPQSGCSPRQSCENLATRLLTTDWFNRSQLQDRSKRANVSDSQAFSYDNLNRVSDAERGILDSSEAVQLSDVKEGFDMDLLGNFNGTNGIALNQVNSAVKHSTNATNEITSIDYASASGGAKVISDPFTTSLADIWTQDLGTWSISP